MKTFFNAKTREVAAYVPIPDGLPYNTRKYNTLKVSVDYAQGGMSYFSGDQIKRGYKIRFRPMIKHPNHEEYILMGKGWDAGIAGHVMDADRYSAVKLQKLAASLPLEILARNYIENDMEAIKDRIASILFSLS